MTTELATSPEKTPADIPEPTGGGQIFRAPTDIIETDSGVTLMLDMPGVSPEQVDVTLDDRVLTIRGRIIPGKPEGLELIYSEYSEGDFERAFTLSEDFDSDRIEAEMRGGVLTVRLHRAPETQPKKIAVKAA